MSKNLFKCQKTKDLITPEACNTCPHQCLPLELIESWVKDGYKSTKNSFGVTTVLNCLRQSFYNRVKDKEYLTPDQMWIFNRGHALHNFIGKSFQWEELKISKSFVDFEIIGYIDAYSHKEKAIIEVKSVNKIPIKPLKQHIQQIQSYYCIGKEFLTIEKLYILYVSMNNVKMFEVPIDESIMEDLITRGKSLRACLEKNMLPDKEINPYCSYCPFKFLCDLNLIDDDGDGYRIKI